MQHVPVEEMEQIMSTWDEEIEYEDPTSLECPGGVCEVVLPDHEHTEPAETV